MNTINPKVVKRLENTLRTDDRSICPLDGKDFKSDVCKHSVRDLDDAINGYRSLKILGLL